MKKTEIECSLEGLKNAEKELLDHLTEHMADHIAFGLYTLKNREVLKNLCEAYLDEWATYQQIRKGKG